MPERRDPELLAFFDAAVQGGAPARRESDAAPAFKEGDRATVTDDSPREHTGKARYIRGKTGVVEQAHGTFICPDSAGNGRGDDLKHVYVMPTVNDIPADFPAAVLYDFRLAALGNQVVLWATIGLLFGWLTDRSLRRPYAVERVG